MAFKNMEYPQSYVVWDLETTGLNHKYDKILEFAAVMVKDGKEVGTYSTIINHNIDIPEKATAIHGIDRELCEKEGKSPEEVFTKILEIFREHSTYITHNGLKFDNLFIAEAIRHHEIIPDKTDAFVKYLNDHSIDTAGLYKAGKLGIVQLEDQTVQDWLTGALNQWVTGLKYNVGACCDELGIDRSTTRQHRALGDVKLTNEIYKKLCLN
jgi:DNA polymerase III epsilon subunit-like protein